MFYYRVHITGTINSDMLCILFLFLFLNTPQFGFFFLISSIVPIRKYTVAVRLNEPRIDLKASAKQQKKEKERERQMPGDRWRDE